MKVRMYENNGRDEGRYVAFVYTYEPENKNGYAIEKILVDAMKTDVMGVHDVFLSGSTFDSTIEDSRKWSNFDIAPRYDCCKDVMVYYLYFATNGNVLNPSFERELTSIFDDALEDQGYDVSIAGVYVEVDKGYDEE